MKVLIVSYEGPLEGAGIGKSLDRFCAALERRAFDFDVLVGNHTKQWMPKAVFKYWTTLKRYDLIHFWGGLPTLLLTIKNRPYILTCHGSDVPGRNPDYDSFYAKKWVGYSDAFYKAIAHYAVTENLSERVRKQFNMPCITIPNGVEFKQIKRKTPIHPMMVTVGRLIPLRRTEILIDMMEYFPSGHLTIVGDGPMRDFLETRAKKRGLAARVKFVGWQYPDKYLREAYIYVSSGDATGIPLAMLEAIEYRLPLVVAETPGLENLNCVKCAALPEAMAVGVGECIERYQELVYQPGVWTWDKIACEYMNEYYRVLDVIERR